jgi:hypothetical protein
MKPYGRKFSRCAEVIDKKHARQIQKREVSCAVDEIIDDWQGSERYLMEPEIFGGDPDEYIRRYASFSGRFECVRHWVML